jgi:hypothetical protein
MVLATIVVLMLAVWLWIDESHHGPTCTAIRPQISQVQGYVELVLKKYDPVEPTFDSDLFLRLEKPPVSPLSEVTVWRSAVGTYARHVRTFSLRRDGPAADAPLQSPGWQDFSVVSRDGLHRNFPFDSRSFEFTLDFSADLPLDAVRLVNRIPGFYIPCDGAAITWVALRQLGVRFDLQRNRLIQLFAVVFVVAAVIFAYIIIYQIQDTTARATSVASYFLSLWSLERILQDQMHTFPTIFDFMIMVLSILMLVLLTFSIAAGQRTRMEGSRPREDGQAASECPPYK